MSYDFYRPMFYWIVFSENVRSILSWDAYLKVEVFGKVYDIFKTDISCFNIIISKIYGIC